MENLGWKIIERKNKLEKNLFLLCNCIGWTRTRILDQI